jgi:hypothetical protein
MMPRRLATLMGLLMLLGLFAANIVRVRSLQMDEHVPIWVYDAIPPALSDLAFRAHGGYASLRAVSEGFYHAMGGQMHESKIVGLAINQVLQMDQKTMSTETILLGGDDKGIVDFVKISFSLFGYDPAKIIYLYFIFLGVSLCAFLWSFQTDPWSQAIVGAFLTSHYLILPMVAYHPQLQAVTALRFLPVLSLVACLHCLFFVRRPLVTPVGIVTLLMQVGLLIFVVHMRAVAAWQTNLILVYSAGRLMSLFLRDCRGARTGIRAGIASFPGKTAFALPAGLVLLGLGGLNIYRHVAFDPRYSEGKQILTRPVWHNFVAGFSFDPVLAGIYHFKIDDLSEMRAVGNFLTSNGRGDEWVAMGGTSPGFSRIHWTPYDRAARDFFFSILKKYPAESVAAVTYYKSASLGRNLAWLYGFRREVPDVSVFVSPELGEAMAIHINWMAKMLDEHRLRFILWDRMALLTVLAFTLLLTLQWESYPWRDWLPLGLLTLGSLIPSLVGYPAMHTVGEAAVMIATALYVLTIFILSRVLRRASARLVRDRLAPSPS